MLCFFLGIATGPMFVDLFAALSPLAKPAVARKTPQEFRLAPELKTGPASSRNPLKILTRKQKLYNLWICLASAPLFTFSTLGITIMTGEIVASRVKGYYERLTTCLAVMNASTESTYMAEIWFP